MEKSPFNQISNPDEIIFAPRSQKAQLPVCDKTITTDISEDFNLPEYLPEIRRLLRIAPRIPFPSQYIGNDTAEFSGNVLWNVLYVDSEGALAKADLASAYEASASMEASSECLPETDFLAYDEITADNVVGKVLGPRKLNIRCKLNHHIRVFGDFSYECNLIGECSEQSVRRLTKAFPACVTIGGVDDTLELEEKFPGDEATRVVYHSCGVCVNESVPSADGVVCRGNLMLKLLLAKEGAAPECIERTVPFTANPEMSLDGDGNNIRAFGKVSDISFESTENEIICRIQLCIACEAQKNVPTELCKDIFSTESVCDTKTKDHPFLSDIVCFNTSFAHDASAQIEGLFENAKIIDANCSPRAISLTNENGHYILNGNCRYNVLFGGENEYAARELEFPFSINVGDGNEGIECFFVDMSSLSCKVKPEGENMAFSADLCASVRACGKYFTTAVESADFSARESVPSSAFTIAYPSSTETLWDIAKKYYADPATLAKSNGLSSQQPDSPESLSGVKFLII